jgi:hypothetical protein
MTEVIMKGRRLLVLSALSFAIACEGNQHPTGPSVPIDPSKIISDGAHSGGNPDFYFLPPLVPLPINNPNFKLGTFNNALQPSLKVEICELKPENLNTQGRPTAATACVAGAPLKAFAPGTVRLVNLPLQQWGWWALFKLPPDGFYYVLWDTRQSNLSVGKFYRIKVFIDGATEPLGVADVDPISNLWQWRYTLTGEVVQLVNGSFLPIPFRVQKGALCNGATLCTSVTVTNHTPNGDPQIVRVEGNAGPIAGALLPDGWLPPPPGPQSVVFTIHGVNTGANNVAAGTQANPCHANLPLQQFNSCFNFSTIPKLPVDDAGNEFAKQITVAVCYVLQGSGDAREKFAEIWSSGPNEPPHPLPDASDALILTTPTARNCGTNLIGFNSPKGVTGLASAGWRKLKGGVARLFGVQTAYAVDLGLGGLTGGISNIGPALSAKIQPYTDSVLSLGPNATTTSTVRIVGNTHHSTSALTTGIGGLTVTYTVAVGNGTLRLLGSEAAPATSVNVIANTNPIDPESPVSGGGFAPVNWTMPALPGTYTLTATGPATGGPVTFTATVPPVIGFNVLAGPWVNENASTNNVTRLFITVDGSVVNVEAWGKCLPTDCDWGPTIANTSAWSTAQQIVAFWDQGFATQTQTITYLSATRLQAVTVTHFVSPPGPPDLILTEFFTNVVPPPPPPPIPPVP